MSLALIRPVRGTGMKPGSISNARPKATILLYLKYRPINRPARAVTIRVKADLTKYCQRYNGMIR